MAIHGRKGWVRGQGQLNGVGGYEFLLAVVDDRQNLNDLVRVKIWKANGKMETVVYDSQPDCTARRAGGDPDEDRQDHDPALQGQELEVLPHAEEVTT